MGKAGRFACIFTPMALTIASLICLAIVLSGQAYQSMELSRSLYFFKVISNPKASLLTTNLPSGQHNRLQGRP